MDHVIIGWRGGLLTPLGLVEEGDVHHSSRKTLRPS
jgi:hypothetical protein